MAGEFKRHPITKMLIGELKNTTHQRPKNGEDQYEPQLFLTPTGAMISKIMISGAAIEKEDVGTDNPFWRIRVADPSGAIMVYAGQYQPEASAMIANMEIPSFVTIVGKPSIYQPESGVVVSIRPESITIVDEAARNDFILDAASQLLARIKELKASPDTVTSKKVAEVYQTKPPEYMDMVRFALTSLLYLPEDTAKPAEKETETETETPAEKPAETQTETPTKNAKPAAKDDKKKPEAAKPKPDQKNKSATPPSQDKKSITPPAQPPNPASKPPVPPIKEPMLGEDSTNEIKEGIARALARPGNEKGITMNNLVKQTREEMKGAKIDLIAWEDALKILKHEGRCVEPKLGIVKAV